jgi:hypothetical protein
MWFDSSAAACGEMVFDLVKALGVPLSREIATHVYLAILTDTGSFHYSSISPRTFEICRETSKRASIRCWSRAMSTTATAWAAQAVRRRAERDADRRDRPHRHRLSRSRHGARGRRHYEDTKG